MTFRLSLVFLASLMVSLFVIDWSQLSRREADGFAILLIVAAAICIALSIEARH